MLTEREIDHSVLDHLTALFTATPPNGLPNAYHVYTEDNFHNPSFTPVVPFVWVVDKNVRPTQARLPLIIIHRGAFSWLPFELGNRSGQVCTYSLLIFGRNRGEPSDLASFLKRNLDPLPIYNYSVDPKTLRYKVSFDHMVSIPQDSGGDVGIEAALANQETVIFDFEIKEL